MASFIGTLREFNRYIGPQVRGVVQQITRPYKQDIGRCEFCGDKPSQLDAAHIHGHERTKMIEDIVSEFTHNEIITIDLGFFEREFKKRHYPIEEVIKVLCKSCHRGYDSKVPEEVKLESVPHSEQDDDVLSIDLIPSDSEQFKKILLVSREATIETFYNDNTSQIKKWNASRFKESSHVMGNLRSRPEFRADAWKKSNIKRVEVRATEIA